MRKIQQNEWQEVILSYLGRFCVYCGGIENLHIHHIVPVERGGRHELANLEVVCKKHHKEIHDAWRKFMPKKIVRPFLCPACRGTCYSEPGIKFVRCPGCGIVIKKQYRLWNKKRPGKKK